MSMLEAALEYAQDQFAIFPILPYSKQPAIQWRYAASTDEEQVRRWWEKWPDANIGMPTGNTGRAGRRIEVLDIDVKSGNDGRWILNDPYVEKQLSSAFARVITPSGGFHYWFRAAEQPSGKLDAVDFKATGGYVLVPPSQVIVPGDSAKSGEYFFANIRAVKPTDTPLDWEKLRERYGPTSKSGNKRLGARQYPIELLAKWMREEPEGQRNRELFKKTCIAVESGYRDLSPIYYAAIEAGLDREEIQRTIQSAARQYGLNFTFGSRSDYLST